jgi:hypothetical protein
MNREAINGIDDHNLALESASLSRFSDWDIPRPNIINYPRLLDVGKAVLFGATMREDLVYSRLTHHRTDTFGVEVSADVTIAFVNTNPSTQILDVEKEAVWAAASPLPAAALANVVSNFGVRCQPGTCAVGSVVYMMIPLRDSEDRDVYPVPAGGIRNITAPNLMKNGQDAFSLGQDAYSLGQDAYSLGQDAHTLGTSAYATGTAKPNGRVTGSKCKHCHEWHGKHHAACEASKAEKAEKKRNSKKRRVD